MSDTVTTPALGKHGAARLPAVDVDSYNLELKDDEGFLGDRASRTAFHSILENWRKPLRKLGADPFGDTPSDHLSRSKLDAVLKEAQDIEAIAVIQSAIEDYAQELALVLRRFLKAKAWEGTERIAMGGGFRDSHVGELAIARANLILKADGNKVDMVPIHHDPDEAALIGSLFLAPAWIFKGHDSILAIDIGGTNIRAGVVLPNATKAGDLSKASVWKSEKWRHADAKPGREKAIDELTGMLKDMIKRATKEGLKLAPFIGIACPGKIEDDGDIAKGAQNLPGNWESSRFNLPARLAEAIPAIGDDDVTILMHNDAVVQGLSEVPFMRDVKRWGVLTIGTGLGNARFTNRQNGKESAKG